MFSHCTSPHKPANIIKITFPAGKVILVFESRKRFQISAVSLKSLLGDHVGNIGESVIKDKGTAHLKQGMLKNGGNMLLDEFVDSRSVQHFSYCGSLKSILCHNFPPIK